jgi:acetyltransferase-like isoleucine patch superfamily enzyme
LCNSRIQSHSFICSAVVIWEDCFIGHGTVFVNDKFSNNKVNYERDFEETIISNNVIIGSNATILPVQVCSGAIIGAGSVVTKNINQPGKYAGNPAKLIN